MGYHQGMVHPVLVGLAVFALAFAFNAVAARAIQAVAEGDRWGAARADVLLGLMALACMYCWIEVGWWTAAPELAGGFFGTALGTKPKISKP